MHTFLQFELWKDCNNKCKFCFNDNSKTDVKSKIERLDFVSKELETLNGNIKKVGFIGGEFFDNQLDDDLLLNKFISLLNTALSNKQIEQVLITTSLIYENTKWLSYVLHYLINTEKLMICTSWDTKYRFHTQKDELIWENNVKWLHTAYPQINVHVEICPTQWHIDDVLNNKFNIKEFEKYYNVVVDYTDLNSGFNYKDKYSFQKDVPGFFPKRDDFLKFLQKVYIEDQATKDKFLNFENMSTLLWMDDGYGYRLFKGYRGPVDGVSVDETYSLPPMHENKSDYIDSHVRMRKDVIDIWEIMYE